jgi:ABC-type phosphate transport system substrate-binding protein
MTKFLLSRRSLLGSALASLGMVRARAAASGDVAIVVRPETPVDNLSLGDLRRVLLGDRQFWSSNLRVTLLVRAPGAHEREVVLNTVYQMSEAQYRQYWIAKVFRAEASSAPRIVYSSEMAVELTSSLPGALAFVDASQVPKNLKVVKINGALPGDSKYPLR